MLDLCIRATLLLSLGFASAAVLRRSSAAGRHLLWASTLSGLIALPFFTVVAPRVPVTVPVHMVPPTVPELAPVAPLLSPENGPEVAPQRLVARLHASPVHRTGLAAHVRPAARADALDAPDAPASTPAPVVLTPSPAPSTSRAIDAHLAVRLAWLLWAVGAAAVMARLVLGFFRVRQLVKRTTIMTAPEWTTLLARVSDRLALSRRVTLRMGPAGEVPVTCGIVHPIIIVPSDAESWDEERRALVLTHELAHVSRRDVLTHVVGQFAVAAFWFHPLVWFAAARMRVECERACDDLVLTAGARPSRYAGDLLALVHTLRGTATPAVAALAMARRTEIEGRLLAILDGDARRGPMGPRWITAALSVAALAALTLAAVHPVSASPLPSAVLHRPVVTVAPVTVIPPEDPSVPRDVALADAATAAAALPSDAAKRTVLLDLASRYCATSATLRRAFFAATDRVASNAERRRVLLGVLARARDAATLVATLRSAAGMSSDADKAIVLRTVAGVDPLADPTVRRAFFAAANTIASSAQRAAVLLAVIGELHARASGPTEARIAVQRATITAACQLASITDRARVQRAIDLTTL